jgi:hypothetical protein
MTMEGDLAPWTPDTFQLALSVPGFASEPTQFYNVSTQRAAQRLAAVTGTSEAGVLVGQTLRRAI